MNESDHKVVFFNLPLRSQERMEPSASVQNRGQEMLLLTTAEKRGLFLQQSRSGLVSLSSPLFLLLFVCIDGRCCSPRTKLRGTAISSSSWPFGI